MATPPFTLILAAQSMSACSELFGQRTSRRCHNRSVLRNVTSMAVYCGLQAFVVLGAAQLLLPASITGGQGSLSLLPLVVAHPGTLVNALNNSVYWLALAYLLREPLGALLVVLAFLFAAFLVQPVSALLLSREAQAQEGEEEAPIPPAALLLGCIGALACASDIPLAVADRWWAALSSWLPCCRRCSSRISRAVQSPLTTATTAATTAAAAAATVPAEADAVVTGGGGGGGGGAGAHPQPPSATAAPPEIDAETAGLLTLDAASASVSGTAAAATTAATVVSASPTFRRNVALLIAFIILASTSALGVGLTNAYSAWYGINSFGYAAVDQCLLPFTTLPLAALLDSSPRLRRLVGEREREAAPGQLQGRFPYLATLRLTWAEVCGGSGSAWYARYWAALIPFHFLELARALLFFYLVTQYSLESTYLQLTLTRIALVWGASVAACTWLRDWVGVSAQEAAGSLHPANLSLKAAATGLLVLSLCILKGIV